MITKSELQEMIERGAWELCEHDHDIDKKSYIKGAESLLPLLMKAVESFEWIQAGLGGMFMDDEDSDVMIYEKCEKTLKEISEAVKGKK